MTYEAGLTSEIMPGAEVYTRDGNLLGTVKEVGGTKFKVSAKPDFWLGQDFVGRNEGERVTLIIATEQLGDYIHEKA